MTAPTAEALARDHGISRATAYRYLDEVIIVLAQEAPGLREALDRASEEGFSHVILDGKLTSPATGVQGTGHQRSRRGHRPVVLGQGPWPRRQYPGDARPGLWVSEVEPGSVHDITAARAHALPALYQAAGGLPALADPGYEGAGIGILIPVRQPHSGRELDINNRTRNALQRSLRCLGERGFALLTGRWRILRHITASPSKIGRIAGAALVLTHFEHGYVT